MLPTQRRAHATLLVIGTTIGAGVFGVPAMIGAWGVIPGTIGFAAIAAIALGTQMIFAEAVIGAGKPMRMMGYGKRWMGKEAGLVGGIMHILLILGSNLIYIILGGEFVGAIADMAGLHLPIITWQILFWAGGSIIVLYGLRLVDRVEHLLTWLLISVMMLLIALSIPRMDVSLVFDLPTRFSFEPYGVFIFSLLGLTAIPEAADLVRHNRSDLLKAVFRGSLISAILTYGFGVSAWLASGGSLGRGAVDVLSILPVRFAFVILIFGFLAVITSYITTALYLRNLFQMDFKLQKNAAFVVALGIPLILLFLTARDFLFTVGFVGSVLGAAIAILSVLLGQQALRNRLKPEKFSMMWWWSEVTPLAIAFVYIAAGIAWVMFQ